LLPLAGVMRRLARAGAEWASRTGAATMAPATGSVTAAAMAASLVLSVQPASTRVPRVRQPVPERAVAAVELSVPATAGGQLSPRRLQPGRARIAGVSRSGRQRSEVTPTGASAREPDSKESNLLPEKPSEGGTSPRVIPSQTVGGSATIAQETAEPVTSIAAGAQETVGHVTSIAADAQETVGHVTSIATDAQETAGDVTSNAAGALEPLPPMDEMNKSTMVLGGDG
jgi:methyl-accepting chemotaxis protein